jgi:sigma-B regulation protein RsbU (phosphoserine phosphatase)
MTALSGATILHLSAPAILNTLPDGAYITDLDRNILFWNTAAERITGWPARDVVGRSCNDNILVHIDKDGHELCGKEYCPLHRSIVTGQPSEAPLLVYARNRTGDRIPVEVSVSPIRNDDGTIIGGIELFRDLTEEARDLARARLLQNAALESPRHEDSRVWFALRYTPSEIVGGDFYRVERLSPDCYGILLADVMGHGLAAALYAMELRSLWEAWRGDASAPDRFMTHLSRQLRVLAADAGYFATALYLTYNAANGGVALVRAGHPAPLLKRPGAPARPVGRPQPAIGMLNDTRFVIDRFVLEPGDGLLLYTDGAVEATNAAGDELGEQGLVRLLSEGDHPLASDAGLAALEEQILRYTAAIHLADDLTMLALMRP